MNKNTRSRRDFLKSGGWGMATLALSAASGSDCLGGAQGRRASKPNIIFLLADDLGYADLGCFGQKLIRTPHLDRMAAESTRFTQCYSGSAVCAPSRNALMTGQHTGHTRIRGNSPQVGGIPAVFEEASTRLSLEPEDVTIAELLKKQVYATGLFGKWGLAEPGSPGAPEKKGFDEWLGYYNQDHAVYYYTPYLWRNGKKQPLPENQGGHQGVYTNDLFTRQALEFIDAHRSEPFFLYLAYTIPHKNYEVPDLGEYARKDWPADAKIFAAMISRLDGYVGQILEHLKKIGIDGQTIVFFCSDNGEPKKAWGELFESSLPLRGKKGSLYEGGIRTPMIVRWPGHVPAGRTSTAAWYFPDFLPTALALAGGSASGPIDGISILPTLRGEKQDLADRFLYWEFPNRNNYSQAIRWRRWKAVRNRLDQPFELYDLVADVSETRNIAMKHPEVMQRIRSYAGSARTESPHWPQSPKALPLEK